MTKNANLKRRVRARMSETGETYMQALAQIMVEKAAPKPVYKLALDNNQKGPDDND